MSIVTIRPDNLAGSGGVWYNDGFYGPTPEYWKVNDNWDGTYNYGVEDGAWADYHLGGYSLAANERCWHARVGVRLRSFGDNGFTFNADAWVRAPFGDGGGVNVTGPHNWTTRYGDWYGGELSQSDINNLRVVVRDNGGVTRPQFADVWAELEILHQPTVSNVAPNNTQTTRQPQITWAYSDPDGRLGQRSWRAHLRRADNAELIYDSGENFNGANWLNLPVALGNGTYQVIIQVSNENWGAWYSNWTYASPNMTINANPDTPTGLARTGDESDNSPVFSANLVDYVGYDIQTKARFEVWNADGSFNPTTVVGSIDSGYVTGGGAASAEYIATLPLGRYVVRVKAVEVGGQESGWSSYVSFQVVTWLGKDLNALWNVATPLTTTTRDRTYLWNVVENNGKQLGLVWTVFQDASKSLEAYWNVATSWERITEDEDIWTRVIE